MIVLKIIGWILLGIIALVVLALCLKIRIEVEYSDNNTSVLLRVLFLKVPIYPIKKKEKNKQTDKNKQNSEKDKNATEQVEKTENSGENEASEKLAENSEGKPTEDENSEAEPDGTSEEAALSQPEEKSTQNNAKKKKKSGGIKELLMTVYNAEGVDGLMLIARRTVDYFGTFLGSLLRWIVVNEFQLDVCCTKGDAASTAIYYGEVCSVLFPMLGSIASKCKLRTYEINVYPDYIARFSSASFILKFYFIPIVLLNHGIALVLKLVFGVGMQLLVKIFLYLKKGKNIGDSNKNIKEKSEGTNE